MPPRKRDTAHQAVKDMLKAKGIVVYDSASIGHGYPDLIAIHPDGRVWLIEVKAENGRFTKDEVDFMLKIVNSCYRVIGTPEQAAE